MRTPLAAIIGFADLLMAKARADQRASIGHIQSSGRRLLATLDNLIDLTQIRDRTLRIRPIDLAAVLLQAVEDSRAQAQDKDVALTLAPPELALPRVMADGWALRRITDNLIANGIKFTNAGGSVEVSARPGELGAIVTVRDTGAGMPPAVLEQIGVPFYQADSGIARRFEGMGAGLALSLRLADAMGAALHFDSTPGNGTTASLVLPRERVGERPGHRLSMTVMSRHPPGRRADYRWFHSITTRWMDNDVFRHVNNVNYFSFFDTGSDVFRNEQRRGRSAGRTVHCVVAEVTCRYHSSVACPIGSPWACGWRGSGAAGALRDWRVSQRRRCRGGGRALRACVCRTHVTAADSTCPRPRARAAVDRSGRADRGGGSGKLVRGLDRRRLLGGNEQAPK